MNNGFWGVSLQNDNEMAIRSWNRLLVVNSKWTLNHNGSD